MQILPKIKVQYFGSVRAAVLKSEEDVGVGLNITAYQLLQKLADDYGENFREEIFEKKTNLREDVTVTVNGKIIAHTEIAQTNLKPGDTVALFPTFPGGG